ncbi:acyltransferase [Chryseobacterium shigense]|uniref:Peptidoglycan/LPS O-acetylase OafA/YrhL, contains acyltransferase and SGNH-hydrolase domains n=1 Tax=Chryseobacterium shigense TaxID=297244 RepID=A0A1N7HZS9_9FLAO|nr:acyltransferase [Chryseobacterium shigense]PQA90930.1 acyltransferase [Chryseobacterium shigense]SIS30250.1 Peptidoglycan/LPS O-acetylase OafA/YrhL, contains acyltransferase and SGNH-hydrolase domains [Chryseobacterium shigense]
MPSHPHSTKRLYGLDHLRTLAILLVLLYHYRTFKHPEWIDTVGKFGWTGVDLFFVLSGFLISGQLFKEMEKSGWINVKAFYTKRFFRIIPPYFFTLFLYFAFPFFRERESLSSFWKFVTFTQNYGLDVMNRGTFSHAWSLCIEEQFYLFLPLLLLFALKTRLLRYTFYFAAILILFSLTARFMIWENTIVPVINTEGFWKEWYREIYYPTHTRLDGLAVGVIAGYLMQYSSTFQRIVHGNGNQLLVWGVLLLGISFWVCNDQVSKEASVFGFTLVALSYGLILMSAVSRSSFLFQSQSYGTAQLAGLSYAVYLSHKGIIHMIQYGLDEIGIETSDNICLLICLAGCILGGLLYRFVIEKPSSKLKIRILNTLKI